MYKVLLTPRAIKELDGLPRKAKRQVAGRIDDLAENPRPAWSKKIGDDFYRGRSGAYRILYQISDKDIVVLVIGVGDRKDVYQTAPQRLVADLPKAIARLAEMQAPPPEEE